jgi:hypothetical protein
MKGMCKGLQTVHCSCTAFVNIHFRSTILNVVVERLMLLLHIQEIPGSNLGPETSYPDWGGVHGFPQSLQANVMVVL